MVGDAQQTPSDVREVIDRTSDREWHSLILYLGRYALQKSRRFYWRTGSAGELPYGEVTESLVSKALVLWMTGRRRWNREEYADLRGFLEGVIDSLLSHSAAGYDNRGDAFGHSAVSAARTTPESDLLEKERTSEMDRTLAEIIRHSQHDIVVLDIIGAIQNGAATRRDIVKVTGRSAADIDNGLKRLRRVGATVARQRKSESYEHQQA
jgi:hypothetical protein